MSFVKQVWDDDATFWARQMDEDDPMSVRWMKMIPRPWAAEWRPNFPCKTIDGVSSEFSPMFWLYMTACSKRRNLGE